MYVRENHNPQGLVYTLPFVSAHSSNLKFRSFKTNVDCPIADSDAELSLSFHSVANLSRWTFLSNRVRHCSFYLSNVFLYRRQQSRACSRCGSAQTDVPAIGVTGFQQLGSQLDLILSTVQWRKVNKMPLWTNDCVIRVCGHAPCCVAEACQKPRPRPSRG